MRPCLRARVEDAVGFGEGGGEGFFDQDVDAGLEQRLGCGGVVDGGDADGCGVERLARGEAGSRSVSKAGTP